MNVTYEDLISKLIEIKKVNFTLKGVSAPAVLTIFNSTKLVYIQAGELSLILRTAALANYKYGSSLENIIIRAEENAALGIE